MSIEKEFVPYQESLELKSIEFDEPCFGIFRDGKLVIGCDSDFAPNNTWCSESKFSNEFNISAPTFSQAFRWFRERHDLCSHVRMFDGEFTFEINEVEFVLQSKETHEEAELACLKKLIQIVKEKL